MWWLIAFFDKKRLVRHKKAATMSSSVTAPLPSYYLHNMHWCGAGHVVEQIAQSIVCKNKTISDGGITEDFWFIKVHTSN